MGKQRSKMVLMIPRAAAALFQGYLRSGAKSTAGVGLATPHVRRTRCGILDLDIFMHMNNAAYFSHCELARWQIIAEVGLIDWVRRNRIVFLVGNTVTRFRKEVPPLTPFEVHTQILGWDDKALVFEHKFKLNADSPPLSSTLCRALLKSGKRVVGPEEMFHAMGMPPELVEARRKEVAGDETWAAYAALDAAQKARAAAE